MQSTRLTFFKQALFFIFALGALAGVNLIWVIPTIRATYSSASFLALETAKRALASVNFSLETVKKELNGAAEELALDPNRKKIIADRILRDNPAIKSVGIAGLDGREVFLSDRFDFVTPDDLHNYAGAPYFTAAGGGTASFGDVFISGTSEPHMVLAVPITQAGIVIGVLISEINIRDLASAIQTPESTGGHMYVVDKNGYQIIHQNLSEVLRRPNFLNRAIVKKVVERQIVADGLAPDDTYVNEQGTATFTVGMPVSVAGFSIFFEQDRNRALAGVREVIVFALITILLGAAAFLIIIRGNNRLQKLNARLNELLKENYESAKMLVRRDLELTRANERLEELDAVKSEFVTIAAHQLRTPLTGIRWSYQTMLEEEGEKISPGQRRVLAGGLSASLRMIRLVNDLLSVARIEEGRFGFHFTIQPPESAVGRAVEHAEKNARDKGIHVAVHMPAHPVKAFSFDEEKIGMVMDNMIDNAIKYTEPGGTVTISMEEQAGMLRITVADTGIGIPSEQIHRVFEKFFRGSNALRFHTSGTGLGLYVSKNIVERHNGTMSVESAEGKGTTFVMAVPIAGQIKN